MIQQSLIYTMVIEVHLILENQIIRKNLERIWQALVQVWIKRLYLMNTINKGG